MYDYIIIGAGFYGKLLAYLLSIQKLKILLIDKKYINKKIKLENIIISKKEYQQLENLVNIDLSNFIDNKINKVIIKNKIIEANSIILNLKKLEPIIFEKYIKNKGKVLEHCQIKKYDFKNNILIINNKKYKYKKLIGADGTFSEVRLNLTNKIQRFNFIVRIKTKKEQKNLIYDFNRKNKVTEKIIPTKNNNIINVIGVNGKNKLFLSLKNLKNIYQFDKNRKYGYFIPNNDLLLQVNNVYFIGDASGLIDPVTNTSCKYNLYLLNQLINNLIDEQKINIKKIKRDIKVKKILKKILFFPIINKIGLKVIIKIYKEDLC